MTRMTSLFWIFLVAVTSFMLYMLKYETTNLEEQAEELSLKIEKAESDIRVLNAEWVYLTNPKKLYRFNNKYFNMKPSSPSQLVKMDSLRNHDLLKGKYKWRNLAKY